MRQTKSLELARSFLDKEVIVTVDRPLGIKHPKHNFMYPVNYGYLKGVVAPDGEDLDVYLLGIDVPVQEAAGVCIAIIHRNDDDDDKLIVVPDKSFKLSDEEVMNMVNFQEKWFDSVVITS